MTKADEDAIRIAEMPLAEHNNLVKTIPSDRTDEPNIRFAVATAARSADPVYPLIEAAG